MTKYFMLLRHAKARKNIENRHGGSGSELIDEGLRQIEVLSSLISNNYVDFKSILYSDKPQCIQTAEELGKKLKIKSLLIESLQPIYLGILDGLSEEEAFKKFPESANLMTLWRSGKIEINELVIPKMTDYQDFYNSGLDFVDKLKNKDSCIIIATRSNLVQLANIMLGNTVEKGGNYKEIVWNNSGMLTFCLKNGIFTIQENLTSIF